MHNCTISSYMADFIYKEIILRYENDIKKNPKGYNFNLKRFKFFLAKSKITISFTTILNISNIDTKSQLDNYFYCYQHSKFNQVVSLLTHIRNSFAHGRFSQDKTYFYLEDYKNSKTCTMKARIKKNLLKKFIHALITLTK